MSSLPCLPHTPKRFAHCTVLFLLKNPMHKQDKWFKNNSHNLTKNKWGKELMTGGGGGRRKWAEGQEVETCILSFHHANERGGGRSSSSSNPGWPSTFARHLESGFVILSFSFHTQWSQRRKKKRKKLLATMRKDESRERKGQSVVWQPPSFFPSCPYSS